MSRYWKARVRDTNGQIFAVRFNRFAGEENAGRVRIRARLAEVQKEDRRAEDRAIRQVLGIRVRGA